MTTPQFLPETLEVQIEHWDYYWKIPNDNHNTSWAPRLKFDVVYGGSTKLRLKADYFMPDGSLWFSEPLEQRAELRSGLQPSAFTVRTIQTEIRRRL
ncbi:MAG: hypothetical protein M3R69_08740 [Acidobacteriota bacterium]|nr:hypothetical protein [Acidobacteriota bacterium]